MPTVLIGRHAELRLVVEALKQARAGQTTAVVLRGEPGIGKSRFLDAVLGARRGQPELDGHGGCLHSSIIHASRGAIEWGIPYPRRPIQE